MNEYILLIHAKAIADGWRQAAQKNKEEAQKLMASESITERTLGIIKDSAADLIAGAADDIMRAPAVDFESIRPESEWELNPGRISCEYFRCKKCHFISCLANRYCGECGAKMKNAGVKPEELPLPAEEKTYESRKSDIFEEVEL